MFTSKSPLSWEPRWVVQEQSVLGGATGATFLAVPHSSCPCARTLSVLKQLISIVLQRTSARNLNLRDNNAAAEACFSALALKSPESQLRWALRPCSWMGADRVQAARNEGHKASQCSVCAGISALATGFGVGDSVRRGIYGGAEEWRADCFDKRASLRSA